jgi:uncharacterized membrane protein (UPF0127 family)
MSANTIPLLMTQINFAAARKGLAGALVKFAAVAAAAAVDGQPQQLPTTTLSVGMHRIQAQLAASPGQRQTGLMFRREMPTHEGMLFVFEQPSPQCFWMRNTYIALSIAFLADDGTVVNIEDMQPQSDASHCSARPVRFALEMNQGWFSKRGIKPGTRIAGAPFGK